MMKFLSKFLVLYCLFSLAGCSSIPRQFTEKAVKGGDFFITSYQKITDPSLPFVFYIEGDGAAFSQGRASKNPTPIHQMLSLLAAMDKRPNVVYLGRPCQYSSFSLSPKCKDFTYWTRKRMSEEVVVSMNDAIQNINNGLPFSLVGFSGGGSIAVLIAARNKNVKDIITISGNLDHVSFNEYHKKPFMVGSLNPIDFASKVRNIPQLHISGSMDERVPSFLTQKYLEVSNSKCVHHQIFDGVTHHTGWDKIWPQVLNTKLKCD